MTAQLVLTVTLDGHPATEVRTRPGDFVRLGDKFGRNWAEEVSEMTVATFLAYQGIRRAGFTGTWDDFLDALVELDVAEEELRPFDGAPGNGSPSSLPSPQGPPPPNGSTPTYEFS